MKNTNSGFKRKRGRMRLANIFKGPTYNFLVLKLADGYLDFHFSLYSFCMSEIVQEKRR